MAAVPLVQSLLGFTSGLVACAALVPVVRSLARRYGALDRPGAAAHKSHLRPTPYGGGIAIWLGTLVACAAAELATGDTGEASTPGAWLALGATAIMLLGLLDDCHPLRPLPRLAFQIAVASLLVVAFDRLWIPVGPAPVAAPVTVLWILAFTNAFNFLDNMDALAAGLALVLSVALGTMACWSGNSSQAVLSWSLAGALLGFLVYNLPPASVFMGDAGGLLLGFVLSAQAAGLSQELAWSCRGDLGWLGPLLLFAVPAYDLVTVTLIRWRRGTAFWVGDNSHISHRLVDHGMSRARAVLVICAVAALTAVPALALLWLRGWPSLLPVAAMAAGTWALARRDLPTRQ